MPNRNHCTLHYVGIVEKTGRDKATIQVFPEYCPGLRRIEAFSHLIVLYWMHKRDVAEARKTLLVYPKRYAARTLTGVFACRSPSRPNPIGICIVELIKVEQCVLTVKGLDAFEGSPIIDIKPYNPDTDSIPSARVPDRQVAGNSLKQRNKLTEGCSGQKSQEGGS